MKLQDFIPPILMNLIRQFTFLGMQKMTSTASFSSYEDALLACGKSIFSEDEYARLILNKTRVYQDDLNAQPYLSLESFQLLPLIGILLSMQRSKEDKFLRVVDVGGAAGTQYFLLKRFLNNLTDNNPKIYWHVVETIATVQVSKELENGELRFFPSVSLARDNLGVE